MSAFRLYLPSCRQRGIHGCLGRAVRCSGAVGRCVRAAVQMHIMSLRLQQQRDICALQQITCEEMRRKFESAGNHGGSLYAMDQHEHMETEHIDGRPLKASDDSKTIPKDG